MTDTTNTAPERIWDSLTHCAGGQIICYAEKYNDEDIEYIRADLAEAIVRAALERAAGVANSYNQDPYPQTGYDRGWASSAESVCEDIVALASDPAEVAAIIKKAGEDQG